MCHWNFFLTIVLAVWQQSINAQSSPNISTLAPTNLTSTPTFLPSPGGNSDSTSSIPLNSSTSFPTFESTSSITESTPKSTPQSIVTSDSNIIPLTLTASTAFPLEYPVNTSLPSAPTTTSTPSSTSPSSVTSKSSTKTDSTPMSSSPTTTPIPSSTSMSTESSTKADSTSMNSSPTTPIPSSTSSSTVTSDSSTKTDSSSPTTTPIPSTPSTPAPPRVWDLHDDRKSLEWEPTSSETVIIKAEEGYKIAVKVLKCNVAGENREYVIIGTGEAGKGVQFSYTVKRQPSYLFNTNVLYAEFNGTDASTFRANFSRIGEALTTTTTEITTSTQFVPTPSVNDSAEISVFVSGRKPSEYKDEKVLNRFRDAVHKMASEYCFNQNFDLAEDITINNVKITRLMPCHSSWPGYETCAQITFEVPVYQKEDTISPWKGYQLNSNHLTIMWNRYHKKYISDDIETFDVPDSKSWVKWQIIVSCGTTVVFLVCLLVLKYFCNKFSRESNNDDMEPIIPMSNEDNEASLEPYYIQQLPPLFENTYQDITPGLSPIINTDVHNDLLDNEDMKEPKIDLSEEELGESGA